MSRRLLVFLSLLLLGAAAQAVGQTGSRDLAVVLTVKGPIGPATGDYIARALDQARAEEAHLVVLRIDTPGGLVSAMREINQAILASPIPVVSYVAPAGARAASAGTYIVYASHVAAMAPGTNLGAATPVRMGVPGRPGPLPLPGDGQPQGDGQPEGDKKPGKNPEPEPESAPSFRAPSDTKATNDMVAYIRSLAQLRGRNAEWAEKAVREAASLSAEDALEAGVVELIADDLDDLLAKLDGREVKVFDATIRLATDGIARQAIEPDWRSELLAVITNPNVAYILMLVGIYGILFEFYSPGLVGPGVIGAICLLLALYALQVLPVNYAGLALLVLGLALMVAETFVPSFGVLGIGGIAAFVFGSVLLLDTDAPGFGVSWILIGSVAGVSSGMMLLVLTLVMRARRREVVTGPEQMLGSRGRVVSWSGRQGRVRVQGEIWQAESDVRLTLRDEVRVTAVDGLMLRVEPQAPPSAAPGGPPQQERTETP